MLATCCRRDPERVAPATSPVYTTKLFWLLAAATFFEGYDGTLTSLLLDDIHASLGGSTAALGISRGLIEAGLFAAFFLARRADRIGRRRVLLISVIGYTIATAATAAAWDLTSFTVAQASARVFLGAEFAVAVTIITETAPADRRARTIGRLLAVGALGDLTVGILAAAGLHETALEWRLLYLLALLPLVLVGWLRRQLPETPRFETLEHHGELRPRLTDPFRHGHAPLLWRLGAVHFLRAVPFFAAQAWFFWYATNERHIDETTQYLLFLGGFLVGLTGYAAAGSLGERLGRRPTVLLFLTGTGLAGTALFQATTVPAIAAFLAAALFFGVGTSTALAALTTEAFPTHLRGQAAAWVRNVFEVAGFVIGPILAGVLGDHHHGPVGSVGTTLSLLFLLTLPAIWLARRLPETAHADLDLLDTLDPPTKETTHA